MSSVTGAICLAILDDAWDLDCNLKIALKNVWGLMAAADCSSPQDAVVAEQMVKRHEVFLDTAAYWTKVAELGSSLPCTGVRRRTTGGRGQGRAGEGGGGAGPHYGGRHGHPRCRRLSSIF